MSSTAPVLNQPERLKALRRTGLLDSPPEALFDRLTRMAAQILEVPAAIMTLVDENRQFFKSCIGLPEPWASYRETPLSHSFCQFVTASGEPLVVNDARLDERVRTNLAIQDLNVVAYLGVPLATRDGHIIGSFAAIDSKPHTWTERDKSLLIDLAALAMAQIELPLESEARYQAESALERSREDLRTAVEAAGVGIWNYDVKAGELIWSDRCRELFGIPLHEPITLERFFAALHPEDRAPTDEMIRLAITEKQDFKSEYRAVWLDGSIHWIAALGRGIYDAKTGEALRLTGAAIDITERKQFEQQLREAKEAAEAANHTKDNFLATLSHELRTPLNPVLMLASELEHSDELPERLREDFALIRKNVELEARLIDDLLDLTRVLRGKLQLNRQVTDAHLPLRQAVGILHSDLTAKQIDLTLDLAAVDSTLSADAVRLQQIFWNLVKNAIKFTPPRGKITIRSRNLVRRTLRVEVADTGIGIEPDEQERIFLAFAQSATNSGHRFGGLGLGLSISRLLVEMHGGRIWAESAGPNTGSTFIVELPLVSLPADTKSTPQQPLKAAAAKLKVLLVEDHEPTRSTLSRLLRRRGHEVLAAETLAEARRLAARHSLDLVISDLGLPDGTGDRLMEELRATYHLKGIALSGYGMEEDVQRSLRAGFVSHLTKPISIEMLDHAIEQASQNN
ncbi:ATP-binding protein [Verrucomicrobiota bacterium sgz303538]